MQNKRSEIKFFGLIILDEYPFIAASVDCLVTFEGCDDGLLEVKSSNSLRHEKTRVWNMDYLELVEDRNIHLIHNYEYYYPNLNLFSCIK